MIATFERHQRKRNKCRAGKGVVVGIGLQCLGWLMLHCFLLCFSFFTGIDSLELEKNKLLEENKKFDPILLFYKNKLLRTKTNAEDGLKQLFKDKTFVLVGELNML